MEKAAKAFFKKSINRNGEPESVVIDKSDSNIAALKSINKEKKESAKITPHGIECVHMIKKCQVWGSKRGNLVFENFVNLMEY